MSRRGYSTRAARRLSWSAEPLLVSAVCALATPAVAQQGSAPAPAGPPSSKPTAPDGNTEKLIRLLVRRGILTESDAAELLKEIQAAPAGESTQPQDGEIRVPYIPESIQKKMTEQLKQQVLEEAKAEGWAEPNTYPDWLHRISFFGDFRFREEADLYNPNNNPNFIDFNAINTGSPFDVSTTDGSTALPPLLDTTENREQPRFRLRLGMTAQVDDGLSTTFRITSGNTTNPVSTNQTLGSDFNKYTLVIDQAFLNYNPSLPFNVWLGRFPKPWVSTNLVWWDDLAFDGLAMRYHAEGPLAPFITAGGFAVENTALEFPTTSVTKVASHDKWLYAGQVGMDVHFTSQFTHTTAVAFYDFENIQGELSSPCLPLNTSDSCNTDDTRPEFMQRGNTVFEIRDIVPSSAYPNSPQYQYFGLASPFREADGVMIFDLRMQGDIHVVLTGDYVQNIAFHAAKIAALNPVNNLSDTQAFAGGNKGFQAQLLVGYPTITKSWQWSVLGGYKHVDSDAVVDAFNDPDFFSINGVGGTNDKGYFVIASCGLARRTWLSARWFSGTQVSGPPLAVDTFQLDLNAGF
jgi:hypothetical protein